jgi:uncharacterized cupin superfamily protein
MRHSFVGAGDGPCVLLMVGSRAGRDEHWITYPVSEVASRHGAAVDEETVSPHKAYAPFGHWQTDGPKPAL